MNTIKLQWDADSPFDINFKIISKQAWILVLECGQCPAKIKLYPTKAASQRPQTGVKLINIFLLSYRQIKTQNRLVSIGICCSGFTGISA